MEAIESEEILRASRAALACGEEFPVQVKYSVIVVNCTSKTDAEKQRMIRGLGIERDHKAGGSCSDPACPFFEVVKGEPIDTQCAPNNAGQNVWTETWTFTVKCVP